MYSFVACPCRLAIDHASTSKRSTVPTPIKDTAIIWMLITYFPPMTQNLRDILVPAVSSSMVVTYLLV